MPERTSKRGRLRVDWVRAEVGRIRLSWGYTKKERDEFVSCLDRLYENAQLDELRAIRKGELTPAQVIEASRKGRLLRLDLLLDVKTRLPLWATLEAMVAKRGHESEHQTYTKALRTLQRVAPLREDATIQDLLTLDRVSLRAQYRSPVTWNHMRQAVLVGLTQLFGTHEHEFRKRVRAVLGPSEQEPRRPLAVTPALFWQLVDRMPNYIQPSIICLAVTGMRISEYLRCTEKNLRPNHSVYVPGRKTAGSTGLVHVPPAMWPHVVQSIPCVVSRNTLGGWLRQAAESMGLGSRDERGRYSGLRIHDLRHLTAIFAFEGGASVNEVQTIMRHADAKMTMRYSELQDNKRAADAIGRAMERAD